MKILLIADEEEPYLWDYYVPGRLAEYDLILSAGDLNPNYLSFLVTMANKPLLYVHGNHDISYSSTPPEGCDCIEDSLVTVKGLRILGLGGCQLYNGKAHQYSQEQMQSRARKLRRQIRRAGGVDIILTHAPPKGVGDGEDLCHEGFTAFLELMDEYHPRYLIHGHQHMNYRTFTQRVLHYGSTEVINACGRYVLTL